MITKYKIFEKLNQGEPEEGDYVIMKFGSSDTEFVKFITNNIGKITEYRGKEKTHVRVKYLKDVPSDIKYMFNSGYDGDNTRQFLIRQIVYWSKDKKDLERVLKTKNYSL